MQSPPIVSRIHRSLLASSEKRLLTWLAAQLPRDVSPDHLTLIGMAGAALCGLGYGASGRSPLFLWLAVLGLLINWFGDSLDGTLARHRGTERPRYGFFIDHTTDILSQVFIFLGLGASPYMQLDIALLALLSYWMAALLTFIRAVVTRVFQISYFGIGPTEIRLTLTAYTLALIAFGPLEFQTTLGLVAPASWAIIAIAIGVFSSFVHIAWNESRILAAQEPVRLEPSARLAQAVSWPPTAVPGTATPPVWNYKLNRG
jgi:phosphatidylglycerophosphate synthase